MYRPSPLVRAYCLEEKLQHPGQNLLQVRGQQHQRQPQAQLRHRPGLLRQGAGPDRRDHRDRRGPVGHRPGRWPAPTLAWTCDGVSWSRSPMSRSPSARRSCSTFGADVTAIPLHAHGGGPPDPGRAPRHHRQPGLRHLRGGGDGRSSTAGYRYVLGSVLNQVLLHQSIIGLESKAALDKLRRISRISSSAAPAAAPTWAASSPPSCGRQAQGRGGSPHRRRGARLLPLLHPRHAMPMTSATPARLPRWPRCTPWAAASSPPPTTPAACATTA